MHALAAAIFTAALALLGKVSLDFWNQYRERRALAAALAGEIASLVFGYDVPTVAAAWRRIAAADQKERSSHFAGLQSTPTNYPIFDRLSDRLGLLPVSYIQAISVFYQININLRIVHNNLSNPSFLSSATSMQFSKCNWMAGSVEVFTPLGKELSIGLNKISQESFRRFIWNQIFGPSATVVAQAPTSTPASPEFT